MSDPNSKESKSFLNSPQYEIGKDFLKRSQNRREFLQQKLPRFGERFLQRGNFDYELPELQQPEIKDPEELEMQVEGEMYEDEEEQEDGAIEPSDLDLAEYREYLDSIGAPQIEESEYAQQAKQDLAETFGGDTEHLFRYEDIDRGLQLKRAVLDGQLSFDQAKEVYSMLGSFVNTDYEMLMSPIAGLEQYEEIAGEFTDQIRVGDGGDYGPPPVWTGAMYWGDEEYRRIREILNHKTWEGAPKGVPETDLDPEDLAEENHHCTHTIAMGALFGAGALLILIRLSRSKIRRGEHPAERGFITRLLPMYRMGYTHTTIFDGLRSPVIVAKPPIIFRDVGPFKLPWLNRNKYHFQSVTRQRAPPHRKKTFHGLQGTKIRTPIKRRLGGLGIIMFFAMMGAMECLGQFDRA